MGNKNVIKIDGAVALVYTDLGVDGWMIYNYAPRDTEMKLHRGAQRVFLTGEAAKKLIEVLSESV